MIASFLGTNAFAVAGDRTAEFSPGVRVLADCGADGARYGTVAAALYAADADRTTVTLALDTGGLTAAVAAVLHGNDVPASLANHGHTGPADGGAVAHGALAGVGTNSHAAIDAFLASKAVASGLASLDAASRVVQDPANAAATPAATKIVVSDAAGTVDAWVSDATTGGKGKVRLATVAETQAGACADKAVTPAGLAGAAKGLLAADTTLHVATTGNDATGDGSPNAPFASISRALASIRNKLIASGVTVTIQVADGTYAISSTITINHPDADKIQIIGNTSAETVVAIAAIDTTARTITVAGDYTSSIQVGDILGLTGSSTSGLNGAYVVSDVSYSGGNTVLTCSAETIASDIIGSGSIFIMPRNRVKLVLASSMVGFSIKRQFGGLSGFRIDGPGLIGILCDCPVRVEFMTKLLMKDFDTAVFVSNCGFVYMDYIISKNCSKMVYASGGRFLTNYGVFICDMADFMFLVDSMGFGDATPGTKYARGIAAAQYSPDNTIGNYNAYLAR